MDLCVIPLTGLAQVPQVNLWRGAAKRIGLLPTNRRKAVAQILEADGFEQAFIHPGFQTTVNLFGLSIGRKPQDQARFHAQQVFLFAYGARQVIPVHDRHVAIGNDHVK